MDRWIVEPLQSGLEHATRSLSTVPEGFFYIGALVLVSVLLACISQKLAALSALIVLVVFGTAILIHPTSVALLLAVGSYIGSALVAITTLRTWRKDSGIETRLSALQHEVEDLRHAEERRTLIDLRSHKDVLPSTRDSPLTIPPTTATTE